VKTYTARMPHIVNVVVLVAAVLVAAVTGMAAPFSPWVTVVAGGLAALTMVFSIGPKTVSVFFALLSILLVGYAVQGRGFAYLGISPLYVGELVLILGIAALTLGRARSRVSSVHLLLVSFMILGLLRTAQYVPQYGFLAIRDAALWYYGAFAIVLSLLLTESAIRRGVALYATLLPYVVIWLPVMSIGFRLLDISLPRFPGSPLPIISLMKSGDQGVVLAGLAAFILSGLYVQHKSRFSIPSAIFWSLWAVAAVLVATGNRGGMLAIVMALSVIALLRPSRDLLKATILGTGLLMTLFLIDPQIEFGGSREFSARQLATNVVSIFSDETGAQGSVQSTKNWRLDWWSEIYGYTIKGDYFWTGKGFGVNLADDDGFQVLGDSSLRSPHNGHMSVLARMGVPGIATWIALHSLFAWQVLRGYRRSIRMRDKYWSAFFLWILSYWAAIMTEATFDVYLESPQGGIWLWCVLGMGIAGLRVHNEKWADHIGTSLGRAELP